MWLRGKFYNLNMYIPNKFPYTILKKQTLNGLRKYLTPDGYAVPSVTTILDATKSEESKKALQEWRNRVGHKQAQQITTEAAGRGTRMHKWIENHIKTGFAGTPGTNPYSKISHDMAQEIINNGLTKCQEFWGTETSLYFPEVYAGTTDLIGIHDNIESVMDHKQTNKPKKREWIEDYFIQLTAYATAHNEVFGTNIRKGVVFMCVAPKESSPGIWSKPEYQEFIIEGLEFDKYKDKWFKRLEQYYSQFL